MKVHKVMQKYRFRDLVYRNPYSPHYDKYRGHEFVVDHYSEEDEEKQHVWLTCTSDHSIKVLGYVELCQIEAL